MEIINESHNIAKTAKRNKKSLKGDGHYAKKFLNLKAESKLVYKNLKKILEKKIEKPALLFKQISDNLDIIFDENSSIKMRTDAVSKISLTYKTEVAPHFEKNNDFVYSDNLFPLELVENTRSYIEKIAKQASGCYDNEWYDACAVMIRRLLETLIIECFESQKIPKKIKNSDDNFFYLDELIKRFLKEEPKSWNISRNAKQHLLKLKRIGDQSAHSRYFTANKQDIDQGKEGVRILIQELLHISKLK